jgi:hypothetical protein
VFKFSLHMPYVIWDVLMSRCPFPLEHTLSSRIHPLLSSATRLARVCRM